MSLGSEDIEFIKQHLGEWLAEQSLGKPPAVYEIELRERMVRVEEELKHQRELIREGFEHMDKRMESLTRRMDRFMFWSFSLTIASAGTVIAVLR